MKKEVRIIVANPAGNITIFVLDQFDRSKYQSVANQLLEMEEYQGEQVCFIKTPYEGVNGKMEMCGLEFCGNASRTFGLICAKDLGMSGKCQTIIDVSGCDENLTVDLDLDTNYTKIKMPLPLAIEEISKEKLKHISNDTLKDLLSGSTIVDLGGIVHVVMQDKTPTSANFLLIKEYINSKYNPPAMGAMFYHTSSEDLVPIVYVADVDTTYWEGSCGSGSTAVAAAFSWEKTAGTYSYTLKQPAGTIISTVEKTEESISNIYIEGPVSLSHVITVEIDL